MATNRTVIKKPAIKKEDKDGIDINQVLSQSSKKGKVSIGKHETIIQRAETTPFDSEDAPIGTYEVRMHSTKKSKKKSKKKDKSEPTVLETPAPRYDCAFLEKIFHKNKQTVVSKGASQVATTTPVQSSTPIQSTNTNTKSQQGTSGTHKLTTPASIIPPTPKQKIPTTTTKNPSSSIRKVANVTPVKTTPILSRAATKSIPVVPAQPKPGNYYSKLAASKYNRPDSNDSSSSSSSSSSSDGKPPRLDSNKVTKGEESSSSKGDDSSDDSSYDEGEMQMAIQRSLGIAVPIPAKKIAYRKTADDKKPAAKKAVDTKKPTSKPKISVDTLYGNKVLSGQVSIEQDRVTGKINLSQEFDKEAGERVPKSREPKPKQDKKDTKESTARSEPSKGKQPTESTKPYDHRETQDC
jgi:hypothetical protein